MKDIKGFIKRLADTKEISPAVIAAITEKARFNRYEALETILSPGHNPAAIYYIQSGIIRGAFEGEKDRITAWFQKEGELVIPPNLFNQTAGEEYIISVTKVEVITVPLIHILKVAEKYDEAATLMMMLSLEVSIAGRYRESLLRLSSARARYNLMKIKEPYLTLQIPHYLIASYLNITKETFSRIHKGLPY
ncbi:Crp/Fnr family transcriptional regulator [Mucilaginibacter sp. SMC90]|uniref:Crp/Fnr family transcriptional regulator n=1 Tax=Mucilaginibacter sp. SMC90 TaxID=2929803 RepID=UPI001FB2799F|nr:Crp/Fnr family transcriptional regulator [Mucilaginibacter sp. SMC90]UOE47846.1 Crp/Fnr family transcriptional regulator [Mucilaginibacter sp. SMC90]